MTHQHHVLQHIQKVLAALDAAPSATELAAAPVLQRWQTFRTLHGSVVLAGLVRGHPALRDGPIRTSGLLSLCPAGRWARTVNRWYRLASQPYANTPDETPIMPDNLAMALLIDGLHPLTVIDAQKIIAGIRLRLRAACGSVTGGS